MKKHLDPKNRGFALPLAVLAMVLLLIIGGGLLTLGVNSRIVSTRNAQQIKARSAADSGLAKALWDMTQKLKVKSWATVHGYFKCIGKRSQHKALFMPHYSCS